MRSEKKITMHFQEHLSTVQMITSILTMGIIKPDITQKVLFHKSYFKTLHHINIHALFIHV